MMIDLMLLQIAEMHQYQHSNVVHVLGASLGHKQMYLVLEPLGTTLWDAIHAITLLDDASWHDRLYALLQGLACI